MAEAACDHGKPIVAEQPRPFDEFAGEHDFGVGASQQEGLAHIMVTVGAGPGDDDGWNLAHDSTPVA